MKPLFNSMFYAVIVCLSACSRAPDGHQPVPVKGEQRSETGKASNQAAAPHKEDGGKDHDHPADEEKAGGDTLHLTAKQILAAGIDVGPVQRAFGGAVEAPAVIVADPKRAGVVAVAVGGRIAELRHNLGEHVAKGEVLAVIESGDAAQLRADVAAARRQMELAQSTLQREERLHRERVSAEQDYLAARNAAAEARIRTQLAEQRLAAAGGDAGGPMNQLRVRSPISGHVISRTAALGDVIAPNAELFRIADLSEVAVELSLSPDEASRVKVGAVVDVSAGGRAGSGRVALLSRVVDPATRQVNAIAALPNGKGTWRIGETVRASVLAADGTGTPTLAVPQTAIQTVEDKPSVFVRTKDGFAVRHLVVGPASAGYVTVVSGLIGDEQIAVSNSYVLKAELGKGEGGEHEH